MILTQWGSRDTIFWHLEVLCCLHPFSSRFPSGQHNVQSARVVVFKTCCPSEDIGFGGPSLTKWRTYSLGSPSRLSLRTPMGKGYISIDVDFVYLNQSLWQEDWDLISDWFSLAAGWGHSPLKSHDCYTTEDRRVIGDSATISTTIRP